MQLDVLFYSILPPAVFFIIYLLSFAYKVHKKMGRFASCIDAEAFALSSKVILNVKTKDKRTKFGTNKDKNIYLFYNKVKIKFSPVIKNQTIYVDTDEYSDLFYTSLAYIMDEQKNVIVRNVKWYFLKNFWRMESFYRILFDFRIINIFFGTPILRFVPQNILKDPDTILQYIPSHLRVGAKLTLVDIDRFSNRKIRKLQNHDSVEKLIIELKNLLKIAKSRRNRKLTRNDTEHLGEVFNEQLFKSKNHFQFILDEIKKCHTRENLHQLGSDRVGECKLHALGAKLSPLFAADILDRFSKFHRTDKRLILRYETPGFLYYYSTLYHHQYPALKFARKLDNIADEMMFLACFNEAKYEMNNNLQKLDSLLFLLQERWNTFDLNTQIYLTNNQTEMDSLIREI